MDSTVIVALPSVDDKVNKLSSEKIPHLTLCFLGDLSSTSADDLMRIVGFVQHAASQLSPFHMVVDHRGTLGPDDADVLFFETRGWSYPRIADFREHLLMDNTIRRLYDSVEQYPEWTPHLTMGYPETPAKEDDSDYPGVHNVEFDRIAVWYGDFEGPTFRLQYDEHGMEVAMSDMTTAERGSTRISELFHSGVKGMKWGVRKDKGHEGERVKTKKLDKLDQQWEKEMGRTAFIKLHNAAAKKMNDGGIDRINNKPEYKDVDFNDPKNSALYDKYLNEHETAFQKAMVEAGPSLGMNPSGTKAFVIKKVKDPDSDEEYEDVFLEPVGKDLKHAEGDTEIAYRLVRDESGHVTSYEQVELELKHYGVKGMKWGVTTVDKAAQPTLTREKQTRIMNTKDVTVSQRRAGKYATARGGQRQKATDDAVKAVAARQKAKKSTTDSLTNDELKAANERMRLEQEFQKLNAKTKRKGESFIAQLFQSKDQRSVSADLAVRAAKQIKRDMSP
jgi:2'-5' RNA ligase